MKKLLRLIATPPVPVILGTFLLVLLIQIGWRYLSEAWSVFGWLTEGWAHGLCLAVVILVVGSIVLRRLQARAKARSIEAEIRAQGQVHLDALPPTSRSDMEELQERFDEALESLRASKLGRGALYALPWYVIIGPPGSGKTTAITESGLNFPFLKGKSQGRGIRGLGGTRNCDWWFTDQSILLDTAGRYTTQSEDRDEWLSFLGMIKRSRQQKPINGVMVAIAITDILGASREAIEQHAVTIRERIDELVKELEVVFPVYLVFTKCDLLDGFVESFNTLSKEERSQVWGATFAEVDGEALDTAKRFREEFGLLCGRVDEERLRLLIPDQPAEKQRKILSLSLQMRNAAQPLGDFVTKLTEPNPYSEGSELRGFYFTSGTQEGAPIDFVMDKMSSALGLAPGATSSPMLDVEAKSYFLRDLFADVMYGDRDLAHSSSSALKRQSMVRRVVIYGSAVIAAAGIALSISGWASVNSLYEDYEQASEGSLELLGSAVSASDSEELQAALNKQRDALQKLCDDSESWSLFRASSVDADRAKHDYTYAIRPVFLKPLFDYVAGELERIRKAPTSIDRSSVGRLIHLRDVYKAMMSTNETPISPDIVQEALEAEMLWRWDPQDIGTSQERDGVDTRERDKHLALFAEIIGPHNRGGQMGGDRELLDDTERIIKAIDTLESKVEVLYAKDPTQNGQEILASINDSSSDEPLSPAEELAVFRKVREKQLGQLRDYNFGDLSTPAGLATSLISLRQSSEKIAGIMDRLSAERLLPDADLITREYNAALTKIADAFEKPVTTLKDKSSDFLKDDVLAMKGEGDAWWAKLRAACAEADEAIDKAANEIRKKLQDFLSDEANNKTPDVSGSIEQALDAVVDRILDAVAQTIRRPLQGRWDRGVKADLAAGLRMFPFTKGAQDGITKDAFKALFQPTSALFTAESQLKWLAAKWPQNRKAAIALSADFQAFLQDARRIRDAFFANPDVAAVNFRIWGFPQMDDGGDVTVTETAFSLMGTGDEKQVKISTKKQLNDDIQDMSFTWGVGDFSQLAVQTRYGDRPILRPKSTSADWSLFRLLAEGEVESKSALTKVVWTLPYTTKSSQEQVRVAISFYNDVLGGQVFNERFFAVRTFEDLFAADASRRESNK